MEKYGLWLARDRCAVDSVYRCRVFIGSKPAKSWSGKWIAASADCLLLSWFGRDWISSIKIKPGECVRLTVEVTNAL